MFANLNQGSFVYVLSLNDGIKYSVGTIESISYNTPTNYSSFGVQNMGSLITLKVNMNSKSTTIEGIPANSGISRTNNYIVTDTKEAMISQVEGLLQSSKDIVNNIAVYQNNIKECETVLKQLSPQFAKESDRDNAISDLYTKVGSLDSKLDNILTALSANNKTE